MDKYTKALKNQITRKKLKPRPKIYFTAKNIFFWGLFVLFIAIASLVTGVFIYRVVTISSLIDGRYPLPSSMLFVLKAFPVLWIVVLIISIALIVVSIKLTKKGYKYPSLLLIAINIGVILFIGVMHHAVGIDKKLYAFVVGMPGMNSTEEISNNYWNNPDKGLLAGKIILHEGKVIEAQDGNYTIYVQEFRLRPAHRLSKTSKRKDYGDARKNKYDENEKRKDNNTRKEDEHDERGLRKDQHTPHPRSSTHRLLSPEQSLGKTTEQNIKLLDKIWKITFSENTPHPTINFAEGVLIKMLGTSTGEGEFTAELLLPNRRPSKEAIKAFCTEQEPPKPMQKCVDEIASHAKQVAKRLRKNNR